MILDSRLYCVLIPAFPAVANDLITQLVFSEDFMEALEEAKAVSSLTYTLIVISAQLREH
jgi:hypothetical protein